MKRLVLVLSCAILLTTSCLPPSTPTPVPNLRQYELGDTGLTIGYPGLWKFGSEERLGNLQTVDFSSAEGDSVLIVRLDKGGGTRFRGTDEANITRVVTLAAAIWGGDQEMKNFAVIDKGKLEPCRYLAYYCHLSGVRVYGDTPFRLFYAVLLPGNDVVSLAYAHGGVKDFTVTDRETIQMVIDTIALAPVTPRPMTPVSATAAPTAVHASVQCPFGFDRHLDVFHGFSTCYPVGWLKDEREDKENGAFWQFFSSPLRPDSSPKELQRISICIVPGIRGSDTLPSDEEFVKIVMDWMGEHKQRELVPAKVTLVDGHKAVRVCYEGSDVFGGDLLKLTGWSAFVAVSDRMFFIEVASASEQADQVERIYQELVAHFAILPIQ